MKEIIHFGPAGNPLDYRGETVLVPFYLKDIGLDAYEYQATYGVRISKQNALRLGENATHSNVKVSMHAPYYVNLSSPKEDILERSVDRLAQAARASEWMGAYRTVFHPGFYTKQKPEKAMTTCKNTIKVLMEKLDSLGVTKYNFAPETTGKKSQLGNLDEIIDICQSFDHFEPTVDFAHVHARNNGCIKGKDDYHRIFEKLEDGLGITSLHSHFTHIEYTLAGERKHHVLAEDDYGPPLEPLLETIMENGWEVTLICETPFLEKDSLVMKDAYRGILGHLLG
ncbi:MAG TPA: TIM barrel protein [Methanobacteriaceae archaeon]|nr:TIM barrel protein [Methanobacteriaceae archaeon]